jgi:hypothetical protein
LLDRVRAAIRLRHFSRRTKEAYVGWVRRYILFHRKRHPSEMAEPDVTAFLTHLAQGRGVSASTQNQALCGLLFMYELCGRPHNLIYTHVLNRGPLGVRSPADRLPVDLGGGAAARRRGSSI